MMKLIRKWLLVDDHTCPWWLAYSWDHRLRKLIHDPEKIIRPYVQSGDNVMDVGCGMGYFSIAMASFVAPGGRVYAVDIQRKMLDILMHRARKKGVADKITAILSGGSGPSLPENVDFVLTFWMLHEVNDKAPFLKSLHSSLKEGGRYLLVEPRVHVSGKKFDQEVNLCLESGFRAVGTPRVGISRAVLFIK